MFLEVLTRFFRRFAVICLCVFGFVSCMIFGDKEDTPSGKGDYLYNSHDQLIGQIVEGQESRIENGKPLWIVSNKGYYTTITNDADIYYSSYTAVYYLDDYEETTPLFYNKNKNVSSYPLDDLATLLPDKKDGFLTVIKITNALLGRNKPVFLTANSADSSTLKKYTSILFFAERSDPESFQSAQVLSSYTSPSPMSVNLKPATRLAEEDFTTVTGFPSIIDDEGISSLTIKDEAQVVKGTWGA